MKWLVLLCVLVALLYSVVSEDASDEGDFTSRYAELASPVPADVDVSSLIASLRSAVEV